MLELKNIKKVYNTSNFKQVAINNISLKFSDNEFVSVLGKSGSGKTSLLNIIGLLDNNYDGDLIIKGKDIKSFRKKEYDYFRNNHMGFIYQNYNLINHISVYKNIEMKLILNKTPISKRKSMVNDILKKVGLLKYANKSPNELSGGQRQRVAVARALVNNPDIILLDEPTGALDSKTSISIMDLIKKISNSKLIIMVTHDEVLAKKYSNRIIKIEDGLIISDTKSLNSNYSSKGSLKLKKTKMNFLSSLYLSFNNIKSKKSRFLLTSFAASIGIIGIALIFSISNGFSSYMKEYEKKELLKYPITIPKRVSIDNYSYNKKINKNMLYKKNEDGSYHENKIDDSYISYINKLNNRYVNAISYENNLSFNLITKENNHYIDASVVSNLFYELPYTGDINKFLKTNYKVLEGRFPFNKNEIVLMVNSNNEIDEKILKILNIDKKIISPKYFLEKEFKIVDNDNYYRKIEDDLFVKNIITKDIYDLESNITLKIVGVLKEKEELLNSNNISKIGYYSELLNDIINKNKNSLIVKNEENLSDVVFNQNKDYNNYNVSKKDMISYLGGYFNPTSINIYPKDFNSKKKIIKYLDNYNDKKSKKDMIIYVDAIKKVTDILNNTLKIITITLIFFSSVSLFVSSIMIGIITYISVLERTKEIGILRSLGARKKDITRIFNCEVLIVGLLSGIFGNIFTKLILILVNNIFYKFTYIKDLAVLNLTNMFVLIIISTFITFIGGFIPAKKAARKNIVESLKEN